MELYPLIDLEVSKQPPFWVYNNYAYVYYSYLESLKKDPEYYVMGDYQNKPKLDESLQIRKSSNQNLKGIYFIENESFEWVEQVYYPHIVKSEPSQNWIFSDYAINCFSARYEVFTHEYKMKSPYEFDTDEILLPLLDEIYKIEIYNFENAGLYPNSQELDLLVKDYLEKIEPDWGIQYSSKDSIVMDKNRVYHFFEYHFKSYKGNCYDFINHCNKIMNEVWEIESPQNLKRQKYFDEWKTEKVVEYGLDRSKLKLEPEITPEPPQQENAPVKNTTYYPASYTRIAPPTKIRPLWVYNNLVHIKGVAGESFELKKYKNHKEEILYVKGDDYRNRLDDFFGYIKQNISIYGMSIGFDLPQEEVPYDWDFNKEVFTILYFDISEYSDSETKLYKFDSSKQILATVGLKFGEKEVLYPDFTKVVRHKLKMIECSDLDSFLNFHFNNCYDAFKFLVHVIEITDDIWENAPNDISCKKVFKKWVKGKFDFLEISNPQVLIDIYISQKKIEYEEGFFQKDFLGNIYLDEFDKPVLGYGSIEFDIFYNTKLEVKFYEFFQLNEKLTPEPPQPVVSNEIEKLKVLCDPSTFGYIITQLFENGYIDLPKRQGDLNFRATARQIMKLFELNTTEEYLANCLNENKNTLSDFTKRTFDIKPYDNKKPSK